MRRLTLLVAVCSFGLSCAPPVTGPDAGPAYPATAEFEALDLAAAGGPQGTWGFTVGDLGDGRSLLFGGTQHDDFGGEVQGDTWLVDASEHPPSFELLTTTNAPSPRYCGCGAYDATRDQFVHVSGRDRQEFFPESWILDVDGRAWTENVSAAHPDIGIACALAYSASEDAFFLYGGGGPTTIMGETWRLPGGGGTWQQLTPVSEPTVRYDAAMRSLDGGATLLMVAGGNPFDNVHYGDAWRYAVAANAWTRIETSGPNPPGRRVPWLRVTPDESAVFMGFGSFGFERGQVHSDLWKLDLNDESWTEIDVDVPEGRGFTKLIPGGAPSYMGYVLTGFDAGELRTDNFALRLPQSEGF